MVVVVTAVAVVHGRVGYLLCVTLVIRVVSVFVCVPLLTNVCDCVWPVLVVAPRWTGIYGMDFYVVLGRRGKRVGRRKHQRNRVGAPHRLTKEDAMKWFQATYEGTFRK